jgi:hypothetical protein
MFVAVECTLEGMLLTPPSLLSRYGCEFGSLCRNLPAPSVCLLARSPLLQIFCCCVSCYRCCYHSGP